MNAAGTSSGSCTGIGRFRRPADVVMDVKRLGASFPTRLSFMRSLIRTIQREQWAITRERFALDQDGLGEAIYRIDANGEIYSYVIFANYLDPADRNDRVIAEQWDMTATLCEGEVDEQRLERLRRNVPLQEKGRVDATSLSLTRANKSERNFEYVVSELAAGRQPDGAALQKVGYLYRTTAVYGSGKFGMADWRKVAARYRAFSSPFRAEMFTCFLIREFSLDQAEHIARCRAPASAAALEGATRRYLGIGNATGLGMAPYLINHPLLIERWIRAREDALASILARGEAVGSQLAELIDHCETVRLYLYETYSENPVQEEKNAVLAADLEQLIAHLRADGAGEISWSALLAMASEKWSLETQELIVSLIIELHPEAMDDAAPSDPPGEDYPIDPGMPLAELKARIEQTYDWALACDFGAPDGYSLFWYRSEEKLEPRLGQRGEEPGADREMELGIAHVVQRCHADLLAFMAEHPGELTAHFLAAHPRWRMIVRRIQAMSSTPYGEIRGNLYHKDMLPLDLLRCKLALFGVGKFSPRSRLWVRNTMFQGAPTVPDLAAGPADNWSFPLAPARELDAV